ncbi:hypothetical protein C8J57DRAFT_682148 [Mycena rebaudengoi]|nr:hypothetical protein C8J57DRAFT_682148 [Mycena rebaudengoi]
MSHFQVNKIITQTVVAVEAAAGEGLDDVVDRLVAHGADVSAWKVDTPPTCPSSVSASSPLHAAIAGRHTTTLAHLLSPPLELNMNFVPGVSLSASSPPRCTPSAPRPPTSTPSPPSSQTPSSTRGSAPPPSTCTSPTLPLRTSPRPSCASSWRSCPPCSTTRAARRTATRCSTSCVFRATRRTLTCSRRPYAGQCASCRRSTPRGSLRGCTRNVRGKRTALLHFQRRRSSHRCLVRRMRESSMRRWRCLVFYGSRVVPRA